MAQEFTIKSETIESKINQLLPSQGGFGAGVDFSASTMVIPIVDVTETAEGSVLRQDLQTALSHDSITAFDVSNATSTLINTTGYYRVFGSVGIFGAATGTNRTVIFKVNDGATDKIIYKFASITNGDPNIADYVFDFIVLLQAGDSLICVSNNGSAVATGCTRQIADLSGNLVNP